MTTVKAILANPRYTGRQVWNRQAVHHHLDNGSIDGGNEPERRRNARQDWVISAMPAHPALVTEADFIAAQHIDALPRPNGGTPRHYRLVGVLRCASCGRRMISHWAHGHAWYRCRHGHTSTTPAVPGQPRTLYLREDRILEAITTLRAGRPREHVPAANTRAYLRNHNIVAVCGTQTVTLERDPATTTHDN